MKKQYTCPMHSEITSDKEGACPKCGMNLVPVEITQEDKKAKLTSCSCC